jgi:hypothetical protein
MMDDEVDPQPPAFYAVKRIHKRQAWADWWVLLHPPYTLWHLSYVAIGASIAPRFDGGRLAATLAAFFLAVGVGAHALDELHGRPLRTSLPNAVLVGGAVVSMAGACALGIVGIERVGAGLIGFIVVGVFVNCAYNLELFGTRLHNDVTFALAWGAFPVLTAYYAQAEVLRLPAVGAAIGAFFLSTAQRKLSTPARSLRRRVASVDGTITYADGRVTQLSRAKLQAPLETALHAMAWGLVALATALVLVRRSGI